MTWRARASSDGERHPGDSMKLPDPGLICVNHFVRSIEVFSDKNVVLWFG